MLMFKAIHGNAPQYFSGLTDMHFDIHGYDTRENSFNELSTKRYMKIVFYIWVANFGMIFQIL